MLRGILRIRRRFKDPALNIEKFDENSALGGSSVRGDLRILRRFENPGQTIEKLEENCALGDPPAAARRFRDPAAF